MAKDEATGSDIQRPSIVDAHVHFYDSRANRHAFLEENDETYEALVGDYSGAAAKLSSSRLSC